MALSVAIVVPVLNESAAVDSLRAQLLCYPVDQVIVVDGGSCDDTVARLKHADITILESAAGRAQQMQTGASQASSDWLLFLHADTQLPKDFISAINGASDANSAWGRFDLQFTPISSRFDWAMKVIAFFINLRSRCTQIATGDQAIFVRKAVFDAIGGFKALPLMEDIELCHRLKEHSKCYSSRLKVTTSARRWREHGVIKTVLLMWLLRLAYYAGIDPKRLSNAYRASR